MAEPVPEVSSQKIEFKSDNDPLFLKKLTIDHPKVANEIRKRVPEWKNKVEQLSGISNFGDKILDGIEYVDELETRLLIESVADEVRKIRENDPKKKIKFIADREKNGSGKWFYDQIIKSLEDTSINDISIISSNKVVNLPASELCETTYFYLDDAANSGQQIQQAIYSFRTFLKFLKPSENREEVEKRMTEKPIDLRIRLLRITERVEDFIDQQKKYLQNEKGNILVNIDLNGNPNANKHMPTMADLVTKLGMKEDDVQNMRAFFYGHHGRYPTTLTTYRHKIQDNMPIILVEGRWSSETVPFLFSQENQKSMRKFYN